VWHDELPESIADTELGRALRDLPPSWREVIWRVEVVGEKVAAIAAEQGRSANSVSATASRARRRLRDLLENPREGLAGVA
jgi:DNA-directed RNA polymerase specialized sigma24 family protein